MEEAIDLFPWIKDTIDFEISLVTDFIQMNDLDPTEVLLPFQWGIDKNGCLKLTDYANKKLSFKLKCGIIINKIKKE